MKKALIVAILISGFVVAQAQPTTMTELQGIVGAIVKQRDGAQVLHAQCEAALQKMNEEMAKLKKEIK